MTLRRSSRLTTPTPAPVEKGSSPAHSLDYHSSSAENPSCHSRDFSTVALGDRLIRPWYSSSYPKRLVGETSSANSRLHVCQFCFKYSVEIMQAVGHLKFCPLSQSDALGNLVHETDQYRIHEVDGEEHPLFCQNLSLFAKLFLDTKSICYDVESFLFYTLIEVNPDTRCQRVIGFFSKEKMSWDDYNLACILVFPPYQKRGLGRMLIAFSYQLSKMERKIGSPEKPLSELGRRGYLSYWAAEISRAFKEVNYSAVSINQLSEVTYIHPEDVRLTLQHMGLLITRDGKITSIGAERQS